VLAEQLAGQSQGRGLGHSPLEMAEVAIDKLKVVAEHADQVFLQAHHQRVHPGIENHVGPLRTHLGE
jgi:hypothetical protein